MNRTVRLAVVAVLVGVLAPAAFAAPGVAQSADTTNPTVENVTTTAENGTVTIQAQIANATEVDVTDIPERWSVVEHEDDDGVFGDQTEGDGVVRWFWTVQVEATVSVTFAVPDNATKRSPALETVAYAGTERGTPVESTPGRGGSDNNSPGDSDSSDDGSSDEIDNSDDGGNDGFGPGFGVGGALAGLGGAGYLLKWRLESDKNNEE